jgi:iron uptake system EfeUOB component EfeO/EfeM
MKREETFEEAEAEASAEEAEGE